MSANKPIKSHGVEVSITGLLEIKTVAEHGRANYEVQQGRCPQQQGVRKVELESERGCSALHGRQLLLVLVGRRGAGREEKAATS